jgi:acetyl-CoA carboxylase biotin carboxylase subunit/3-methylcrotonyl-CoA carboxylase alpha subunit
LAESYLNLDALLRAIEHSSADAVHPGYGLLSEDPRFAQAVQKLGVTFVGPDASALATLGDKIQARALARKQGIPLAPGTQQPLDPDDQEAVQSAARDIGFPILVKAAAGGGGIGMQKAMHETDLTKAVESCRTLAKRAFHDDRVYLERLLLRPRHIEVQVVADTHGNVRAVGDRECSVQRRHQKVVEEAPSPAAFLTRAARVEVYAKAERLVRAAGCVGVSTVEFIADSEASPPELYFLEVNARLQVEHPVTEFLTGLDLVEIQLAIASGRALDDGVRPPDEGGHAVEARLYAEDPERGFIPQPGTLEELHFPEMDGIRVDAGYETGDRITPYYDPLIAKIVAHGKDRQEAIAHLSRALTDCRVRLVGNKGPRKTNLEFLSRVLKAPAFVSGTYDTHLLDDMSSDAG